MSRPHGTGEQPKRNVRDLSIKLPPDLLDRFQRQVPRGERDAFVRQLLEAALLTHAPEEEIRAMPETTGHLREAHSTAPAVPAADPTPETDWDLIEAIWSAIPDEEFAKLPEDGAEQHDHYVYGSPKRDP